MDVEETKSRSKSKSSKTKQDDTDSKSTLKKQIADLINLIFDTNMATKQMESDGYDVKKMPLGKLSKDNIQKGYGILKQLLDEIKGKRNRNRMADLSNEFYSFIPHNVGFKYNIT